MAARQHRAQHGDGLRLVVFNADQHLFRLQNMGEDADTFDDLRGAVLHQAIVRGDVRLTFGGVDNQRLDLIATALQFVPGREARAAQTGDARLVDSGNKIFTAVAAVVAPALTFDPAIFSIGVNHHAQLGEGGRVGHGVRGNRRHGAGGWGMNREHTSASKGQRLAAQHAVTDLNAQLALSTDVLLERDNKTVSQRDLAQRRTAGLGFHLRRMNTAVEIPDLLFSEGRK